MNALKEPDKLNRFDNNKKANSNQSNKSSSCKNNSKATLKCCTPRWNNIE